MQVAAIGTRVLPEVHASSRGLSRAWGLRRTFSSGSFRVSGGGVGQKLMALWFKGGGGECSGLPSFRCLKLDARARILRRAKDPTRLFAYR